MRRVRFEEARRVEVELPVPEEPRRHGKRALQHREQPEPVLPVVDREARGCRRVQAVVGGLHRGGFVALHRGAQRARLAVEGRADHRAKPGLHLREPRRRPGLRLPRHAGLRELVEHLGHRRNALVPFEQRRKRSPPSPRVGVERPHGVAHGVVVRVDHGAVGLARVPRDVHLKHAAEVDGGEVHARVEAVVHARHVDVVHVEHEPASRRANHGRVEVPLGHRRRAKAHVARQVLDAEGAPESALHVGRALRREVRELAGVRRGEQVVVRASVVRGPAEVIGDEGRVDAVGEAAQRVEVALVEGRVPEQVQAHAMEHHGIPRAHRVEALPRRQRAGHEVLADDLEVVDRGPVREEVGVVRAPQPEAQRVARDRGRCAHGIGTIVSAVAHGQAPFTSARVTASSAFTRGSVREARGRYQKRPGTGAVHRGITTRSAPRSRCARTSGSAT